MAQVDIGKPNVVRRREHAGTEAREDRWGPRLAWQALAERICHGCMTKTVPIMRGAKS